MTTLELAALIAGYALAIARLLNAAKVLWGWLPAKAQPLLPALVVVLPMLAAGMSGVETRLDLVEQLILGLGALTTAIRGATTPAAALLLFVGLSTSACASWKPVARTADGIAEALCAQFFSEQKPGLTLEEAANQFCATHEELQPWIDQVLAAKASAGKAALARPGGAP